MPTTKEDKKKAESGVKKAETAKEVTKKEVGKAAPKKQETETPVMKVETKVEETTKEATQETVEVEKAKEETPEVEVVEIDVEQPKKEKMPEEKRSPVVVGDSVEKNVSCGGIKDHECNIAGTHYLIEKEAIISLPNSVATILSNAGIVVKR